MIPSVMVGDVGGMTTGEVGVVSNKVSNKSAPSSAACVLIFFFISNILSYLFVCLL